MRRTELPPDIGDVNPRLLEWIRDHLEIAARPIRQIRFTFAVMDTEYRIRHQLPHPPTAFIAVGRDKAGIVYESRPADKHYLYLKSDTDALTVTLEVS